MNSTKFMKKYHEIEIKDGIKTSAVDAYEVDGKYQTYSSTNDHWSQKNVFRILKDIDFKNKKVLDIGCRDGLFSFYAEKQGAKIMHCFAQDIYEFKGTNVFKDTSLRSCWPEWDSHHLPDAKRQHITTFNLAKDGIHYGVEHHRVFAEKFYNKFKSKLK